MAFQIQKINPLDLQPRKAIGLQIPFESNSVFTLNYQTSDAIKNNILNYLLTGRGERYFNIRFGSGIQNLLFEQITEDLIEEIRYNIKTEIGINFPKVLITNLEIQPEPDRNQIKIYFRYQIVDTNITDEILINFEQ
jgi:phage baseplate assembly protein W